MNQAEEKKALEILERCETENLSFAKKLKKIQDEVPATYDEAINFLMDQEND